MSGYYDWKYVSTENVASLEDSCQEAGVKTILRDVFNVQAFPQHKQEVLTDFHYQNYAFCKRAAFSARQTSTMLSIMNDILLEDSRSSTLTNNVNESFKRFQTIILKHSVERPPKSVQIFMPTDVEPLVNFALTSYFRNFSLYSYVFGTQTLLTVKQTGAGGVELPYEAMPLSKGQPVAPHEQAHEHHQ